MKHEPQNSTNPHGDYWERERREGYSSLCDLQLEIINKTACCTIRQLRCLRKRLSSFTAVSSSSNYQDWSREFSSSSSSTGLQDGPAEIDTRHKPRGALRK
ncbi:hypothetical protein H671_20796 [Cricetulus griseus]|nr:hypothetical protein H671_20796 [Cricetulus griseus]